MAKANEIELFPVDQRMLDLIDVLKENGTIRFSQQFCDAIGLQKQTLANIRKGKQYFTVDHITKACEVYNINANWVHGFSDQMFREQAEIRFISQGDKSRKPVAAKQKRS